MSLERQGMPPDLSDVVFTLSVGEVDTVESHVGGSTIIFEDLWQAREISQRYCPLRADGA